MEQIRTAKKKKSPFLLSPEQQLKTLKQLINQIVSIEEIKLTVFEKCVLKSLIGLDETGDDIRHTRYLKPEDRMLFLKQAIDKIAAFITETYRKHRELKAELQKEKQRHHELMKLYEEQRTNSIKIKPLTKTLKRLLGTAINDTPLSARVKSICMQQSVKNLRELVRLTPNDIRYWRNCGEKTIQEMTNFIHQQKLQWGMMV